MMVKRFLHLTKRQKLFCNLAALFAVVEIILGTFVHIFPGEHVPEVSFSVIVTAFLFSLLLYTKTAEWGLTAVALLCTVIADFFLLIVEPQMKLTAMLFFSVTQICYFVRIFIGHASVKIKIVHICVRLAVILILLVLAGIVLGDKNDALSIVSVIYYANLIMNIAFSAGQIKRSVLFPIGLLLFAFCDALVGLAVLEELYVNISESSLLYRLNHPGFNLMWLFYVPSQMLIVLSLMKTKIGSLKDQTK